MADPEEALEQLVAIKVPPDSELRRVQEWMTRHLVGRRALDKDSVANSESPALFTGNDRLSPAAQVEIYREQFWLRHTESLVEDFPGLSGIIGQSAWQRLVEGYLTENIPTSWTLRDLCEGMPHHVSRQSWLPHHALCVDMARLEQLYMAVFDAADSPGLDPQKLALIPEDAWEGAVLSFAPELRSLSVRYPVADLRLQLKEAETTGESVAIPEPEGQFLVLYRHQRQLYFEKLSPPAAALFRALAEGLPLVPAAERAAAELPEEANRIEEQVGPWFQRWAALGWVTDVRV